MPLSLRSRRAATPSVQMAGGLLVYVTASYAFVAFTGHGLVPYQANLAITFYFLVNVVGSGIFAALEQVATRSTSRALASGLALGPELRRVRRAGAGLAAAVTGSLVLFAPTLLGSTLHGDWALYGLVLVTPVINAAVHQVRGQLAGLRRFDRYAGMFAVEGGARVVFCLTPLLAGTDAAWVYGAAYQAATVTGWLVGLAWLRALWPADRATPAAAGTTRPGSGLVALAFATLFAQLLPNIAPLAVISRLAENSAMALVFAQAAVIARIPLLLLIPVNTMLLPNLTAAVAGGELGGPFARRLRLGLAALVGLGAAGAMVFVVLGPWVLRTLLSAPVDLAPSTMVLLGASTVALIAAGATQPALVALGRDRTVTAGWAAGSAMALAFALLLPDPVLGAAIGQLAGPCLTVLIGLLGVRAGLRGHIPVRTA